MAWVGDNCLSGIISSNFDPESFLSISAGNVEMFWNKIINEQMDLLAIGNKSIDLLSALNLRFGKFRVRDAGNMNMH